MVFKILLKVYLILLVLFQSVHSRRGFRRLVNFNNPELIQHRQNNLATRSKDPLFFASNIHFKYYDANGKIQHVTTIDQPIQMDLPNCNRTDKFAIIVHGWKEKCEQEWVFGLSLNLNKYRGGCIICMDYSLFSQSDSYVRLVRQFELIVKVLENFLYKLDESGYQMSNGYMFGFSFGGQLVCEAGRNIGYNRLAEIDTCDMAGPGFDGRLKTDCKLAARNVQCIHTSRDKGTRQYNKCHQDWRMGNCGYNQIAASAPPFGSHGLCPYIYISSFEHNFYAIDPPRNCSPITHPALNRPSYFRMGYREERKFQVAGELFALTSKNYPYNIPEEYGMNFIYKAEYFDYADELRNISYY